MRLICLFVATLLLAASPGALAQERRAAVPRSAGNGGGRAEPQPSGDSGRSQAQSRPAESRPAPSQVERRPVERQPVERRAVERRPIERQPVEAQAQPDRGDGRDAVPAQVQNQSRSRAVPRGDRSRDGSPRTGVAVRRGPGQRPGPSPRVVYVPRAYNYYSYPRYIYSYPRSAYPYGYGAFGLGYFYYDPYRWHPRYSADVYYQGGVNYDVGELRLDVSPRDAEVWVDGYYAGRVDDFDGALQSLRLESGGYRIEIVAPGFEPLAFDVRITPGRKTTYRGDLRRF